MAQLLSKATVGETSSIDDAEREEALLKDIKGIVESLRGLYDMAYDAYLPLVDIIIMSTFQFSFYLLYLKVNRYSSIFICLLTR